jgi:hypothetical protein
VPSRPRPSATEHHGSLAAHASSIRERIGDVPWAGHEYVRGWGVFALPLDTGHELATRLGLRILAGERPLPNSPAVRCASEPVQKRPPARCP